MTRDKAMRAARETHTVLDPRAIVVALDVVESGTLPVERRMPPIDAFAPAPDELAAGRPAPTPARVPSWVKDPVKWQSMTRAERRAVERHHRRQQRQ